MRFRPGVCRALQHVDQRPGTLRQANNRLTRLLRFFLVGLRCSGGGAQRGINSSLETACRFQHFGLGNNATSGSFLADDFQKYLGRFGEHQDFGSFRRIELNNHGVFQ